MLQRSLAHAEQLRSDAEIRQRVDERQRLENQRTAQAAAEVTLSCLCISVCITQAAVAEVTLSMFMHCLLSVCTAQAAAEVTLSCLCMSACTYLYLYLLVYL